MTALHSAIVALLLFLNFPLAAAEALAQRLDVLAAKHFKENAPGAAVLVTKGGTPLLRKGYGMADLEQGTKMTPEAVFRIGSITKQFTAAAVLQLVESGKVALDDPLAKYFPAVPTGGKTVTIEHLLTHTSGIPSYTDKAELRKRLTEELTPQQIIDTVRDEPMRFDPGTKWSYNNSGYTLLGMIVEQVSGMPYAEYLEKNVFPRAGLTHTRYGSTRPIVPGRVPGYSLAGGKVVNADYVSMSIPYAAGALLSTVDDLARWTAAVAAGKVVDRKLVDKAWTPYRLTSGEDSGYGYGWRLSPVAGERVIQHGGSIHGYSSHAMWLPEHHLYVAVLTNNQAFDPDFVTGLLALEAIGKPWDTGEVKMTPAELEAYAGVYRIDEKTRRKVIVEEGKIYSLRDGGSRLEMFPAGKDEFRFRGSFNRMSFERDAAGNITALTLESGSTKTRSPKTDEKLVTRTVIAIDPAKLDRYTGKYELSPTTVLTISRKDGGLVAAPSGGREMPLFPESETTWFAKVTDVELVFRFDERGVASGVTLNQGGQSRELKKIE
ncbi:MAG TPA: serine hydrolase [Thermoanaerobaculia bacterium]|nr:serine hydrolase [Thermoanaerobaculia bacterium]